MSKLHRCEKALLRTTSATALLGASYPGALVMTRRVLAKNRPLPCTPAIPYARRLNLSSTTATKPDRQRPRQRLNGDRPGRFIPHITFAVFPRGKPLSASHRLERDAQLGECAA